MVALTGNSQLFTSRWAAAEAGPHETLQTESPSTDWDGLYNTTKSRKTKGKVYTMQHLHLRKAIAILICLFFQKKLGG
jgi:hypothetical protein